MVGLLVRRRFRGSAGLDGGVLGARILGIG